MALEIRLSVYDQTHVVLAVGAHEHTGVAALQRDRVDPGPLDRLPGRLQQHPLLRIHRQRLTRRNAEEPGVELRRVRQEPTLVDRATQPCRPLQIPAPIGRGRRDRVLTLDQ
ncbi:hypothetical protein Aple_058430 [Acrocarpospora pleiomorpha]|uniref:Uncharacterized protein n=1 Tax=Acrocarpospora pleiomorpha TaxID=90975 RepID=A0A5M3XNY3_9ACTN|nr:hypothetical protein Aple_058430 [Acrocarpospora pleiomorpha]